MSAPHASSSEPTAESISQPDADDQVATASQRHDLPALIIRGTTLLSRALWVGAVLSLVQGGIGAQASRNASDAFSALIHAAICFVIFVALAHAIVLMQLFVSWWFLERAVMDTSRQMALSELSRIAVALEQIATEFQNPPRFVQPPEPASDFRRQSIARFEQALTGGDLSLALTSLETHIAEFPQDDVSHLRSQFAAARSREINKQTALLDAARQVNDPDRVIEVFSALKAMLEDDSRQALERELARWFLSLVHRRLRSGTIQPDVVTLAQKVSDNFGSTVEGASLRAALPTMRRSVGLCPRCAQPYVGAADACPRCLTAPSTPNSHPQAANLDDPEDEDDEDAGFNESDDDDLPLNHLAIDDDDLKNLRLIDPELDDESETDRRS